MTKLRLTFICILTAIITLLTLYTIVVALAYPSPDIAVYLLLMLISILLMTIGVLL